MERIDYQVIYELSTGNVVYHKYLVDPYGDMTIDDIARDYADSISAIILAIHEIDYRTV